MIDSCEDSTPDAVETPIGRGDAIGQSGLLFELVCSFNFSNCVQVRGCMTTAVGDALSVYIWPIALAKKSRLVNPPAAVPVPPGEPAVLMLETFFSPVISGGVPLPSKKPRVELQRNRAGELHLQHLHDAGIAVHHELVADQSHRRQLARGGDRLGEGPIGRTDLRTLRRPRHGRIGRHARNTERVARLVVIVRMPDANATLAADNLSKNEALASSGAT